jgi:Protein of unknown function (DUF3987)
MLIPYTQHIEKSSVSYVDYAIDAIKRSRYWKEEAAERTWKTLPDTPEAVADAVRKGAMFISTPALSKPYDKLKPDAEIMRFDNLVLDFDDKKNPGNALRELLILVGHIQEIYGIDPYCMGFWCSGGKGFHTTIPAECFNSQDGDPFLPLIYKKMVCQWAASLELPTIDTSMYCKDRGKMFRIENIKRDNGRFKVPLTLNELQSLSIDELLKLSENPREVEPVDADAACEDLAALYQECRSAVHKEIEDQKRQPSIDPKIMSRLQGKIAPCVLYIIRDCPKTNTSFNTIIMNLCKYFRDTGHDLNSTLSIVEKFLQSYPYSTSYTTYNERLKHFKEQWAYHQGRTDNPFRCSYILGMKLKGSAFDCKECQAKEPGENSDAGDVAWEEPLPLNCELLPVSTFNPEWLPEPLREWVKDIAHRQQSPIDYAAIGAMVALSAILGQKLAIRPKRFDDWIVVANLWGCVIGRPSAKKSPALQEVLKPLHRLEFAAKDSYDAEKKEWERDQTLQELKNENAKKNATKAVKDGKIDDAKRFLSFMGEDTQAEPLRKRYVVNDSTIEKLGELLAENPNGLLLFRDELYGFLKTINREDHANDKAFHLECWTGLGTYTYDRIGRGTIDIPNCIESILGCLTPSKIIPMVNVAVNGGVDDDGFLQRFQMMVYPDDAQFKYVDAIPNKEARDIAYDFFKYVSELSFEPGEFEKIPTRSFSKEAQKTFTVWLTALEEEICGSDIHPAIESHLAKYRSLIPSLALLIHIGSYDDLSGDVQNGSLQKAIDFGSYLKTHALRIYNLAINNSAHLGKLLLEKIKIGKLENPFVIRDVKRAQWHGLTSDGSVETALKILVEYGYLRIKNTPTGVKPKIEYQINPAIKI